MERKYLDQAEHYDYKHNRRYTDAFISCEFCGAKGDKKDFQTTKDGANLCDGCVTDYEGVALCEGCGKYFQKEYENFLHDKEDDLYVCSKECGKKHEIDCCKKCSTIGWEGMYVDGVCKKCDENKDSNDQTIANKLLVYTNLATSSYAKANPIAYTKICEKFYTLARNKSFAKYFNHKNVPMYQIPINKDVYMLVIPTDVIYVTKTEFKVEYSIQNSENMNALIELAKKNKHFEFLINLYDGRKSINKFIKDI